MSRLKTPFITALWTTVVTGTLAGCGGDWQDTGLPDCSGLAESPDMVKMVEDTAFAAICGQQGKVYTDKWRCDGERVQIQCK